MVCVFFFYPICCMLLYISTAYAPSTAPTTHRPHHGVKGEWWCLAFNYIYKYICSIQYTYTHILTNHSSDRIHERGLHWWQVKSPWHLCSYILVSWQAHVLLESAEWFAARPSGSFHGSWRFRGELPGWAALQCQVPSRKMGSSSTGRAMQTSPSLL